MPPTIRPIHPDDREQWEVLFNGYLNFYRASIPAPIINHTWERILDESSNISGLVAESDGKLIGLAHYLFHDSTWSDRPTCYLEDLFVDKNTRGLGAARHLIKGVEAAANNRNSARLYWLTQSYNGAARSLYDTFTPPSSYVVYDMNL